jgi:TonB family protein
MITGFNSDIEHGGKVFHVQTEERGADNPVVITLVYCGGEIVTSIEASYADLFDEESSPEGEIRRRMSDQHQGLIRDIRRGRFNPPQMPFGHDLISNRSFDELVLNYLEDSIDAAEEAEQAEQVEQVEQAGSDDRGVKVDRVLNRLERFLSAAQRAQIERETRAAAVEVERAEEIAEATDDALETPSIDADMARPTGDRDRRKPRWIWAAVAAAIVVAAVGLFMLRGFGAGATDVSAEVVPLAPAIESAEPAAEEPTDLHAGVAPVPSPAVETVAETEADDDPSPAPAAVARQTPSSVTPTPSPTAPTVDTGTEEPSPVATPTAEIEIVEDDPPETPQEARNEPAPSEPATLSTGSESIETPDNVDVAPMARQRDLPRYTRRARRLQQEGVVQLRIRIDSYGEVAEVILLEGIPESDLNEAAVEVAQGWAYSPARKDGQRVEVWKDVAFEFSVRSDRTTSVRIRE